MFGTCSNSRVAVTHINNLFENLKCLSCARFIYNANYSLTNGIGFAQCVDHNMAFREKENVVSIKGKL